MTASDLLSFDWDARLSSPQHDKIMQGRNGARGRLEETSLEGIAGGCALGLISLASRDPTFAGLLW